MPVPGPSLAPRQAGCGHSRLPRWSAAESFVVEPLDVTKPARPADPHDVLPLLVPLEHLDRKPFQPSNDPAMFVDLPHTVFILYSLQYVHLPQKPWLPNNETNNKTNEWRLVRRSAGQMDRPPVEICRVTAGERPLRPGL